MGDEGDEYWYPCAVHFAQLAMREDITDFLDSSNTSILPIEHDDDIQDASDDELSQRVEMRSQNGTFARLVTSCRAIRIALRRTHSFSNLFQVYQSQLDINRCISADVRTRFDSTLRMFDSVVTNKQVLQCMQEDGRRDNTIWPRAYHLLPSDFLLMEHIITVLRPIQRLTSLLSSTQAWVGGVLPIFTSTLDTIQRMTVPTGAGKLQSSLCNSLEVRIQMLLGTENKLPCAGGQRFRSVTPTEFVVSSYLNPRFYSAIDLCYGYNERDVAKELSRIFELKFGSDYGTTNEVSSTSNDSIEPSSNTALPEDEWVERITSTTHRAAPRRTPRMSSIRAEFMEYCAEVSNQTFAADESRTFWVEALKARKYPRLGRMARMFMTVPASAMPQERQFSALARRCSGLRCRAKVETLDRDAVVYGWTELESARSQ